MMRLRLFTATAGLCGVLAVAGCGSSSSSASSGSNTSATQAASTNSSPIKILWIGDLTGPAKVYGAVQLAGVEGAASYYNSHGGIDGHKITITHVSDNVDPTTAVSELLQQLDSGTPTMVWAGSIGVDAGALIPVLAKRQVLAIALQDGNQQCLTNGSVTCPNEWTLTDPYNVSILAAANWFVAHHVKKVGILAETDTLSEAETPLMVKALKSDGIPTTIATYPATATDLTPEVQALKGAGVTGVWFEGLGAPSGYALTARAKLGLTAPMILDVAGSSLDLTKLVPAADLKSIYEDVYAEQVPSNTTPGIRDLIQYSKPYGAVTSVPLDVTSVGWDSVVLLNAAVKEAGGALGVKQLDAAMLKIPSTDPLRTFEQKLGFTTADHDNALAAPADYAIVPAGPVANGQVQAP